MVNFLSATFAVLGAAITLWLGSSIQNIEAFLVPIAIGGFIYIASSDLIPQLHKHSDTISRSLLQLVMFLLGIAIMVLLLVLE
jgi:zinc and cadmium transporter